ncbi:MAG: nucleotidyltransferase family protein [Aquificaceae bacterium]
MRSVENIKRMLSSHIKEIRERFGVKSIGVFSLGGDFHILVEFLPGRLNFDNYMDLKFYIEDLIGERINLITKNSIKPRFKDIILESVEYVNQQGWHNSIA